MDKLIWIIVALLSGAVLPIQAGLNARMGVAAQNSVYAAAISFVVGTVGLIIYILVTRQTVSIDGLREVPIYFWLGGLLGAFYVTALVLVFPKLGPGLTFGLIVAGQMIVAVVLDHFNVLVAHPTPINLMKLLGIVLVIIGVVIIRKY
jgi:transporter family-2 protein